MSLNKSRDFAPKGAWAMLSAHGNQDVVQMATPRKERPATSLELKALATRKGVIMMDGGGLLEGYSEEDARKLLEQLPDDPLDIPR